MYDTLLQMGRWFGYRPNYEDIFKIWMAKDAIDWYGFITSAANELKNEIARMNRFNLTPRDFGLKVRQDPNSLIVTARNKMRTGTQVSSQIRVTGKLLETPRLKSKPEVLKGNEKAFKRFVSILGTEGIEVDIRENGKMWTCINKDFVVDLLRSFDTHPWHLAFQSRALADFIDSNSDLNQWDVFLPNGLGDEYPLAGANGVFNVNKQQRVLTEKDGMIKVSGTNVRVGSGGATRAGLSEIQVKQVKEEYLKANPGKRSVPDSAYLIEDRNPLLILHVLENKGEPDPKIPDTLFALAIGIPGDGDVQTANYIVNLVELRDWMDVDVEEDEDDEDDDN
jgi:hypothetical protein